ncbi:MAG: pyruvate formate lyase family protein [Dehalococcoidia bacterium]|nr:pyruvate formate lyase family protein [Dehalococcoidia bacterium]
MRGLGRMEDRERGKTTKRVPYREGVRLDIDRARLITESYKQTEGEPIITRRAKALAHLMDNMKIFIQSNELIVGNIASRPSSLVTFPELWWRWLDKAIDNEYSSLLDDEEREELHEIHRYWQNKSLHGSERDLLPDHVKPYWSYTEHGTFMWLHGGHVGTPNYEKVFRVGVDGLIAEAQGNLAILVADADGAALTDTRRYIERKRFWEAALISLRALARFGKRFAVLARTMVGTEVDEGRRADLARIAEICEWVPAQPPRSLHEALQCYWFVNLMTRILDLQSSGYGERIDAMFSPFYERDVAAGRLTRADAQELVEHTMLKANEEGALVPPAQGGGGGPLITRVSTIGGLDAQGRDTTSEMTYVIMDAKNKIGLVQPAIAIRLHRNSPKALLEKIADSLVIQPGVYSFFNDEMMVPYLMRFGVPLEDARNYSIDGCMRWLIPGKAMGQRALGGMFVLPKCLEYALSQGVNKLNGKQMGVRTPDPSTFKSLDDVIQAFLTQLDFFARKLVTIYNITDVLEDDWLPQPLLSSLFDGCMESGQDCRRYKFLPNTIVQPLGQTNIVNSLAAIQKLVFDDRKVNMGELAEALRTNWEGQEELRQWCLSAPKFGNDDDYVDDIAKDVHLRITRTFESIKNIWGGPIMQDGTAASTYYAYSGLTGASADGRKDSDLFVDGTISPAIGSDQHGPTAVMKSVSKVDHVNTFTQLFNQKFLPQYLQGEYKDSFVAYLRTFVDLGVHHIQFNVIDKETLLDAQAHPEKFGDLVVRVAGFNAFFVDMERQLQDQIIARTEQVLSRC